jgi:hypothetical protein
MQQRQTRDLVNFFSSLATQTLAWNEWSLAPTATTNRHDIPSCNCITFSHPKRSMPFARPKHGSPHLPQATRAFRAAAGAFWLFIVRLKLVQLRRCQLIREHDYSFLQRHRCDRCRPALEHLAPNRNQRRQDFIDEAGQNGQTQGMGTRRHKLLE